ncbi:MAG: choline-sulfatase [Pseudomonadota bacterium]
MTKPDVLLIMADQLAPHFTGAYGHPLAKTPHLDALAARGMRFDAAYCNSPLCAPSRFSFMSGQLITNIAAYDNAAEFPASIPTFAHYLRMQGYRTGLSGKMHFVGPDQRHGFNDRVTTDIYPADFAWTPDWDAPDERIDSWYHNMSPVKEAGPAMASFQIDYDDETGFAARRWLFDRARDRAQGDPSPFALVASFMHPHDPYVARPEWWNLYSDSEIDEPLHTFAPDAHDPHARRVMDGIEATTTPVTPHEIRQARRGYLANVSYFDSMIGMLVQTLEEMGALDNTVIIVTSDHGDMLGERGLWYKMTLFERSARVPLVMAGPGVARGTASNACSLVDVLPTLVEIAGGDPAAIETPLDGRSLWPLAQGKTDPVDEAISEYCAEMTGWPVLMIRRGRFKYIHCESDPPLLFDLVADPEELCNLAQDPAHRELSLQFAQEAAQRWDSQAIRADVIANQKRRRAVHAVVGTGLGEAWDFNPPRDASQEYVRNHMDWEVAARRYRFPPD